MKIILFVLISACGQTENDISSPDFIVVGGLKIYNNGVNFDSDNISRMIQDINDSFNRYYPGLDLQKQIVDAELKVKLYPIEKMSVGGFYLRGNQTINLAAPDDNWEDSRKCLQMYYTLGHEIIHFADYQFLGNTTSEHNTPNLFFLGTTRNHYSETVEYDLWIDFSDVCGYDPTL